MCGIAGIVGSAPIDERLVDSVRRVNEALAHRGPDGSGEYLDGHVAMAMRRLSVIDLQRGWQPLYNEDRSIALIANAEIYNFVELRAGLEAKGHRFASGSDCETIVHLYEDHGLDFVHSLRGMFALALWDARKRRLVLARDRMGEKPLYLYEREGMLLFASELKALLRSGLVAFELDPVAVDLFFHYAWVPEPRTAVKGVRKLDAGHLTVIDVDPWHVRELCYWRPEDSPPVSGDPARVIRAELETLSKLVVRSDVPVGVALSSGLDSSAVAALAARAYPGTIHAFSVGYPGRPPCDERAEARELADHLRIPFHEVELQTADVVREFPAIAYWRDDPIADISGNGYFAVMRAAREQGVPVMLQGQGGDELFWGYPEVNEWLRKSARSSKLAKQGAAMFPALLRERIPAGVEPRAWYRWFRSAGGIPALWSEYREALRRPPNRTCFYESEPDYREARSRIGSYYSDRYRDALGSTDPGAMFVTDGAQESLEILFTAWICKSYLRENGIAQSDRLGMASSVELRMPLLDHKLVEAVIGLRKASPDAHLPPKAVFKAALEGILPESVMRRPKRGFAPPTREWYREIFARYGADLDGGWLVSNDVLGAAGARELSRGDFKRGLVHPLAFKALVLEHWARGLAARR